MAELARVQTPLWLLLRERERVSENELDVYIPSGFGLGYAATVKCVSDLIGFRVLRSGKLSW